MCPKELMYLGLIPRSPREEGGNSRNRFAMFLLILVFSCVSGFAFAQNRSEDYLVAKNWTLPKDAVSFSDLELEIDLHMYQGKPFSGVAYERFTPTQLSRAVSYTDGLQNGLMLLWYPDGSPQMSAYYRDGMLNGRFLGWYQNGGIIYDMVLNRGAYVGDNVTNGEERLDAASSESQEGEGRDNDKSSD
ncbi:MAG: hypothetical protein PHY48_10960 [Candidatus Cloacimonetes bacterium]|nr:hypothetical protein [Candidatus Cloacimonadota bacterium]